MATALVGQFSDAHVRFTTPDGSEGQVDPINPPTWDVSDPTILSVSNVALDADNKGSTCRVTTVGAGTGNVICKPDVDLDPAVQNFIAIKSEDITVNPRPLPQVSGGSISFAPFQDVPPANP